MNDQETGPSPDSLRRHRVPVAAAIAVAIVAVGAIYAATRVGSLDKPPQMIGAEPGHTNEHGDKGGEVALSPEALAAARIEIEGITERAVVAPLRATGAVEPNAEQTQQVTPLVSGRVEQVRAAVGDYVRAGAVLAVISSPDVAEMAEWHLRGHAALAHDTDAVAPHGPHLGRDAARRRDEDKARNAVGMQHAEVLPDHAAPSAILP